MKIEKLNENQIRCTLTHADLAARHLKLSELAYGTEKAKSLFRDMMQQASEGHAVRKPLGKVIFGIGCGLFTMLIRIFASYPEGVSFAILLMNILTPYIDKICEKRMYKLPKKAKEGEK